MLNFSFEDGIATFVERPPRGGALDLVPPGDEHRRHKFVLFFRYNFSS
jgi:hypothetical protein